MASQGRPKKEIDYDLVESLASIFCTQEEIASILSKKEPISVRTLQRDEKFNLCFAKGQNNAKMSVRRNQFKLSENNPTMAIWLGKQYLQQKDNFNEINTDALKKLDELLKEQKNA